MTQEPVLEIVCLRPELKEPLAELFAEIQQNGETAFFHPHPFTAAEAERLCNYIGKDQYYVLLCGECILGYGMLRGWDEGYAIPSLGVFVRAEVRGRGLGKLMVQHLHAAARLREAERIRIKVYQNNHGARQVYERQGYVFEDKEGEQLIGFCNLLGQI
jgi:GNAT superfamily N-acetyltransferase